MRRRGRRRAGSCGLGVTRFTLAEGAVTARRRTPLSPDRRLSVDPSASVTRRGRLMTATWSAPGTEATAVRLQRRYDADWVTVRSARTAASSRRLTVRRPGRGF